jgi:hypothetical protein
MKLIVKHNKKDLFITYISMDVTWALVTFDKKKLSGVFKIDMADLTFDKKQSAYISKINSKF